MAAAAGAFAPTAGIQPGRNNQLQAPASLLVPTATRIDVASSNISLNQRPPDVRDVGQPRMGRIAHHEQQLF